MRTRQTIRQPVAGNDPDFAVTRSRNHRNRLIPLKNCRMEVSVLSKFAELFFFGVTPLIFGLAATPAISQASERSIFETVSVAEEIGGKGVIGHDRRSTFQIRANGSVSGRAACNNYFSTATVEKSTIKFGMIGASRMMCQDEQMDQERRFLEALGKARNFRFD